MTKKLIRKIQIFDNVKLISRKPIKLRYVALLTLKYSAYMQFQILITPCMGVSPSENILIRIKNEEVKPM